jgi:hypothetical protein
MFLLAVVVIALGMLFLLSALALGAGGRLDHPYRVGLVITAALVVGVSLLLEYASATD